MSITTFSELKTALASWVHRTDLTTPIIDCIALAEAKFNDRLRTPDMEASLAATSIASGVITRPTDLVAVKALWNTDTDKTPVEAKSLSYVMQNRRTGLYITNLPQALADFYAWDRTYFRFNVDTGEVEGVYYEKIDALSDDNTTNWLLTAQPGLYLSAALAELFLYIQEEDRAALWEGRTNARIEELNKKVNRESFSGNPLSVRVSN